ncbi:hypothetical protein [Okeania sp. SIO1I7]|uniref:hypothetical protein n=1 Tax=Okeania sp. SIO1I7 TaxID=2607772 RepID=UPI0013F9035A|nr:hypothetical protein [Okeania sp. SIO1I7]NET29198.1 hypothetical protein [Okeania sp. SIO1I7]
MSKSGISALRKNVRFFFDSGSENFLMNIDSSLTISDFFPVGDGEFSLFVFCLSREFLL